MSLVAPQKEGKVLNEQYAEYKRSLKELNLTPKEYEQRIKAWCEENGY